MKRKTIYGLTLLALTLFLLIAVEDLVHVFREPDTYSFGSGNAPWYYQSLKSTGEKTRMRAIPENSKELEELVELVKNHLKKEG